MSACKHDQPSLEYILARRNSGELDTVYMDIIERQSTDSFNIIKYKVKWDNRSDSTFEQEYRLPNKIDSSSSAVVRLVYEQTVPFEDKEYKILQYQLDEPNSEDEESVFYYSPEFGIIMFKWGTHTNCQKLIHTGDVQKDKIIFILTDHVEHDYNFREWH